MKCKICFIAQLKNLYFNFKIDLNHLNLTQLKNLH